MCPWSSEGFLFNDLMNDEVTLHMAGKQRVQQADVFILELKFGVLALCEGKARRIEGWPVLGKQLVARGRRRLINLHILLPFFSFCFLRNKFIPAQIISHKLQPQDLTIAKISLNF